MHNNTVGNKIATVIAVALISASITVLTMAQINSKKLNNAKQEAILIISDITNEASNYEYLDDSNIAEIAEIANLKSIDVLQSVEEINNYVKLQQQKVTSIKELSKQRTTIINETNEKVNDVDSQISNLSFLSNEDKIEAATLIKEINEDISNLQLQNLPNQVDSLNNELSNLILLNEEKQYQEELKRSVVNFDNYYPYVDVGDTSSQNYLDQGYLIKYFGDFYHHNWSKFMQLYYQLEVGSKCIIGGTTYKVVNLTTATANFEIGRIIMTNGIDILDDGYVDLITCMPNNEYSGRLVAQLVAI